MVVLHPDHVASLDQGGNDVGETHVGFPVSEPVGSVKVHLPGVIVEQWPKDRVGETYRKKKRRCQHCGLGMVISGTRLTIVVTVSKLIRKVNGVTIVFVEQSAIDGFTVLHGDLA